MLQTKLELFQYPDSQNCDKCGSFDDCYHHFGAQIILCIDCRTKAGYNRISDQEMIDAKVPDGFGA